MGVREYDYIRGNTAVQPERKIQEREKNREQERRKREQLRKLKQLKVERNKSIVVVASLVFALGVSTVFVNNVVYKLQNKLSTIESEVKEQKDIGEALRVDMLKYASLDKIKSTAENDLSMVYPNEESTITIDMSKEYFSHLKVESDKEQSLVAKIMDTFN